MYENTVDRLHQNEIYKYQKRGRKNTAYKGEI